MKEAWEKMKEFGDLLRRLRDDAYAADPGLEREVLERGGCWLDVAAAREKARLR